MCGQSEALITSECLSAETGAHEPEKERPTPVAYVKHLLSNSRLKKLYHLWMYASIDYLPFGLLQILSRLVYSHFVC